MKKHFKITNISLIWWNRVYSLSSYNLRKLGYLENMRVAITSNFFNFSNISLYSWRKIVKFHIQNQHYSNLFFNKILLNFNTTWKHLPITFHHWQEDLYTSKSVGSPKDRDCESLPFSGAKWSHSDRNWSKCNWADYLPCAENGSVQVSQHSLTGFWF